MKNLVLKNNDNLLNTNDISIYENKFIEYLDVDELTLKQYKVGIKCFIEYLRKNNIDNPTRNDIIDFRNMLRNNYSSNTVNTYMIAIRSLFKYLSINFGLDNVAEDIKGSRTNNIPKKQVLSMEQAQYIYNNLTDLREKCLFSLLITTGLRGVEVSKAKLEDITIHNGEVVLWVQCKKHDSKDEYVKLSNKVLEDIRNYVGERKNGYIFISTSNNNNGGGVTTKTLRLIIKSIFKRFDLDSDTFSLHSTRRSSATIMYENGVDLYSIQQILHHKSSATTTRYINAITRNNNKGENIVSNAILGGI